MALQRCGAHAAEDYVLLDTGMNYALVGRYGGLPTTGILIDKPLVGSFAADAEAMVGDSLPLGRTRLRLVDATALLLEKPHAARFEGGACAEVGIDYADGEVAEYAGLG